MELQEFLDEIQQMPVPSSVVSAELTESEKRKFGPFIAALTALIDNFNHLRTLAGEVEAPKIGEKDVEKLRGGPGVVVHNTASGTTIGLKEKPPEPRSFLPYIFLREGAYHLATDGVNHGDPRTRLTGLAANMYAATALTGGQPGINITHRMRRTLVDGREAYEGASSTIGVEAYVPVGNLAYRVYFIVTGTAATNP